MNDFSYDEYIQLIETLSSVIPVLDFAEITPQTDSFFIIRHDVEFSIERAYALAKIEHDLLDIKSSYFFQVRNYAYNPLAYHNIELIQKIHQMGHEIGLHVNAGGVIDLNQLTGLIRKDVAILETVLELPVDRFSFHRPSQSMLAANIKLEGLLNAYDPLFFNFHPDRRLGLGPTPTPNLHNAQKIKHPTMSSVNVHYFSDSEHQWKYGHPLLALEQNAKKIQLLVHPYSWSKQGLNNYQNFKGLVQEKHFQLMQSMQTECRNFPNELISHEKI